MKWEELRNKLLDWGLAMMERDAIKLSLAFCNEKKTTLKDIEKSPIKDIALRALEITKEEKRRVTSIKHILKAMKDKNQTIFNLESLEIQNIKNKLNEIQEDESPDLGEDESTNQTKFDVEELVNFAISKINEFSKDHQDEIFYAFAIEGSLLSLNSLSEFEKTLKFYKEEYPREYEKERKIKHLKYNPGDWKYQGFAKFTQCIGWVDELYDEFYETSWDDESRLDMAYPKAMDEVITELKKRNAFKSLKTVDGFFMKRVDYD